MLNAKTSPHSPLRIHHSAFPRKATPLDPPAVDDLVRVRSAAEMHAAVMRVSHSADVVVMAAAVADYTSAHPAAGKVAKSELVR